MASLTKQCLKWLKNSNCMLVLRGPSETKKRDFIEKLDGLGSNEFQDEYGSLDAMRAYMDDTYKHIIVTIGHSDPRSYIDTAREKHYMALCPYFANDNLTSKSAKVSKGDDNGTALPVYYAGWFMSNYDEPSWHKKGRHYLKELWQIDEIRQQLERSIETSDYKVYYKKQQKRLHVTAKFIGGSSPCNEYVNDVTDDLFTISDVTVTGMLLTPRTLSCHVVLQDKDKKLFGDTDPSDFILKPHMTLETGGSTKPVQSGPDEIEVQKLIRDKVPPVKSYETSFGTMDDYGECRFYVTLRETPTISVLFNFVY